MTEHSLKDRVPTAWFISAKTSIYFIIKKANFKFDIFLICEFMLASSNDLM